MNGGKLIGKWTLLSHVHINKYGIKTSMVDSASGILIYGADKNLSVLITKKLNPEMASDIIAYSGSYSVQKGEGDSLILIHNVEMGLNEGRKGTSEKRIARINNNVLILQTEKNKNGFYQIIWEKL